MAAAVVFPNMPEFDPPTNAIHFQKMTSLKGTPRGPTWLNRKSLSQQQQSRGNEVAPEPERRITSTITWTAPESQGKTIQNKFKSEIIFSQQLSLKRYQLPFSTVQNVYCKYVKPNFKPYFFFIL